MKIWLGILFLSIIGSVSANFEEVKSSYVFIEWDEAKDADPDTIFAISFEKYKLSEVPEDLKKFTHLKALDLYKNKLQVLPKFFKIFKDLEFLDLGKNNFEVFPVAINFLKNLKFLSLAHNHVGMLNPGIIYLSNLEVLDLYNTLLNDLPNNFALLKSNLKYLDLRGQSFNKEFAEKWTSLLEGVTIELDPPCKCKG